MAERKSKEERDAERREAEAAKQVEAQVEQTVAAAPHQRSVDGVETKQEATQAQRTRYPHERLIRESEAFTGYPPHVMAGALSEDERDQLTVDQAAERIQFWLSPEEA